MHVTYTPEDGDKREWEFKPGRVKASEQQIVEKRAGVPWREWVAEIQGIGPARQVLIWHLMRREYPHLRLEDVDYCDDYVAVELSVAELEENRAAWLKMGGDTGANAEEVEAMFESLIAESRAKFGDGESGKARSRSEPPPTSG